MEAFERHISQLKVYYFDFVKSLVESAYMHELLGLNLLCACHRRTSSASSTR